MTDESRDEAVDEREEQLRRALDMHLGGVEPKRIGEHLGLTTTQAKKLVESALGERVAAANLPAEVRTEIARIDTMLWAIWPKVSNGHLESIDRALALSERRERLINPKTNGHALRKAYDAAIRANDEVDKVDGALVAAGRQIADRIDAAMAEERGENLTKAMYLMPHLMNVLKELGATPQSRKALKGDAEVQVGGKLAQLRSITSSKTKGA